MNPRDPWDDRGHDPAREGEIQRIAARVAATLEARGVDLAGSESSEELAQLLEAVEAFEAAVSAIGGDRMIEDRRSNSSKEADLVIPPRAADESPRRYAERLLRLADRLTSLAEE